MICCLFALFAAVGGVIMPASRLSGCHRGRRLPARLVAWGAVAGVALVLGAATASALAWAAPDMPDTPICRFLGHAARLPAVLTPAQESTR